MAASKSVTKPASVTKSAGKPAGGARAAPRTSSGKKGGAVLALALAMPVALLLLPTTLVLIPAMMPTIVARVVDPGPGRHLTITVGSLNFAGSLWFIHDLWGAGQSFSAIVPTLGNMLAWLAALTGAGAGWAIFSLMPYASRSITMGKSNIRLARIRKDQAALVELWGEPVRDPLTPR